MRKTCALFVMICLPLISSSCIIVNPNGTDSTEKPSATPGQNASATPNPIGTAGPTVTPGSTASSPTPTGSTATPSPTTGSSTGSGEGTGTIADAKLLRSYLPTLKVGLKWNYSTTTEKPNITNVIVESSREITDIVNDLISFKVIWGANTSFPKITMDSFFRTEVTFPDTGSQQPFYVDGYETLTIRAGVYPNALRLKRIDKHDESTTVYQTWHVKGIGLVKDDTTIRWNSDGSLYFKETEELTAFTPGS